MENHGAKISNSIGVRETGFSTASLGITMNKYHYLILALFMGVSGVAMSKPEIKLECEAPQKESYNGVSITITHCVDSYGPDSDGAYEFYYDYETIVFEMGGESVSGKRYADTPKEASLIRIKGLAGERFIERSDFEKVIMKNTISYLKTSGAEFVKFLDQSNTLTGYSEVPGE